MRKRIAMGRGGFTPGDAAVLLSLFSLALAVVYPGIRRAAFEERLALAISDVDVLRSAAHAHLARAGAWPVDVPAGTPPPELVEHLPAGFAAERDGYTVDWNLWETVRTPPDPPAREVPQDAPASDTLSAAAAPPDPPVEPALHIGLRAAITVHAAEEALLAALLRRYGTRISFLGEGSWTLILEEPG